MFTKGSKEINRGKKSASRKWSARSAQLKQKPTHPRGYTNTGPGGCDLPWLLQFHAHAEQSWAFLFWGLPPSAGREDVLCLTACRYKLQEKETTVIIIFIYQQWFQHLEWLTLPNAKKISERCTCSQNWHTVYLSLHTGFEQWVLGRSWAGDWWWQCNTAFAQEWNGLQSTQYMQGRGEK